MLTTTIFIGKTAHILSQKIKGKKILIGRKSEGEKYKLDITLDCILANDIKNVIANRSSWDTLNKNYSKALLEYNNRIDLKQLPLLISNSDKVNIFFSSGGLFSSIVVPFVIKEVLSQNKQIQLTVQTSGLSFSTKKENLSIKYIRATFPLLPLKTIGFTPEEIKQKKDISLAQYFKDLNKLVIKSIQDIV